MKRTLCFSFFGFVLATSVIFASNPTIPERQLSARYEKLTDDWLFAMATPPVPQPDKIEGPFANFYVAGIARTSDEKGEVEDIVAISSKDKQVSFSLFGNQKGYDEISVDRIEWDNHVGKGRVTLKKGTELGTIGFDEMAIRAGVSPVARGQFVPGVPNTNSTPNVWRQTAPYATLATPKPMTAPPQTPRAFPNVNPPATPKVLPRR